MTEPIKLPPLPEPLLEMDRRVTGNVKWTVAGALEAPRLKDGVAFFSMSQLEAYADARVREALEKAVSICEAAYEQGSTEYAISCNPYFEGGCDAIEFIEQRIRSLIPKEST